MKRLLLIAIVMLVIASVICSPISAKIQFTTDVVQYDASGTTQGAFGEEVHVALEISPGESEVKNLVIELQDREALIDDTNPRFISLTAFPAGTSVPITQDGKTFTVSTLQPGQTIILAFNAYPKTQQQQKLHVADIAYSYTQLGDRIGPNIQPIEVRMDNSAWFRFQKAQGDYALLQQKTKSSDEFSSNVLFGSIVLIVIALVVVGYSIYKRYKFGKATKLERERKDAQIKELIKTADSADDSKGQLDLLKAKLRDELGADTTSSGLGIDEDQDEQRERTTKMKIE